MYSIEIKLFKIHKANIYKLSIRSYIQFCWSFFTLCQWIFGKCHFYGDRIDFKDNGHSPPTINELNQFVAVREKKYSAWLEFPLKWHVPIKIVRSGQAAAGDNDGCWQIGLHRRFPRGKSIEHRFFIGPYWWCAECTHVCIHLWLPPECTQQQKPILCRLISAQMVESWEKRAEIKHRQNRWTRSNAKL